MSEVLAQDKSVRIATREFMESKTDGKIRIYRSQPLCGFMDGEPFAVEDIIIKIADFGKGIYNVSS